eukprot:scaffold88928_cov24-Phaeocystis_antarctica.AAC.1
MASAGRAREGGAGDQLEEHRCDRARTGPAARHPTREKWWAVRTGRLVGRLSHVCPCRSGE